MDQCAAVAVVVVVVVVLRHLPINHGFPEHDGQNKSQDEIKEGCQVGESEKNP